jgi:hypothetical protein
MISRRITPRRRGRRALTVLAIAGLVSGTVLAGGTALATVPNADFELEGNTLDASTTPGDDWATLYTDTNDAGANFDGFAFINDKSGTGGDTTYWTGGGSKDRNDIASWQFTSNDQSPDKNDIVNAFAAIYRDGNDSLFFGADRFAVNGDAQMGFWFLSNPICLSGQTSGSIVCPSNNPGKFLDPSTGAIAHHANGDLLVLVNFNNGGTLGLAGVYEWQGGVNGAPVQVLVGTGADCKGVTSLDFCSTSNTGNLTSEPIWPYTGKNGVTSYKTSAFIEGGINLAAIPGVAACFPTFLAETRSSSGPSTGLSLDAQLKDLAFGQFELCQPSTSLSASSDVTVVNGGSTTLTFTETNDGNEDLENVSVTVDNGCTLGSPTGDDGDNILNEGETWTYQCTVSPTSTTTYSAYAVGTGVDSGILVTGNPTCTASGTVICSAAERDSVTVTVSNPSTSLTKTAQVDITYTIRESNTGDDPISDVSIDDSVCGTLTTPDSGDTSNTGILDPGETWVFTCTSSTVDGADLDQTNTATGSGLDSLGNPVPSTGETDSVTVTVTHH